MESFPAFFPLTGKRIVIVGEGEAADAKARLFDGSPAELVRLPADPSVLEAQTYRGALIVFIASDDAEFARAAADAARIAGALVNVVDTPAMSDFATPAIVDRGVALAAIGTGGAAPVLATRLREELEARWPERLGELAELLRRMRGDVRERFPAGPDRRKALRGLLDGPAADAALAGDMALAERLAREAIAAGAAGLGSVRFLTAPPSAELLTLKALRALSAADRIAVEAGAGEEILKLARRDAPVEPLGSAQRLAELAAEGLTVVCVTAAPAADLVEAVRRAGASVEILP
ncbi:MAG: NAD(P)-dependent oxidoreductase [Caulobacteraceae bacterium]